MQKNPSQNFSPPRFRSRTTAPCLVNAGQLELRLLDLPLAEIARAAGATEMAASHWTRGKRAPLEQHSRALEAAFGIPVHAWLRAAPASEAERLQSFGIDDLGELTEPLANEAPGAWFSMLEIRALLTP